MENSMQSHVIYRVKGLRADAIIPIKVIPAIYHLGTASRSRAGLKTFHVMDLRDVWVNLERLMLASLLLNGKHLKSESDSVDAPQHPCFDIFFHHAINRNQEQSKQKLLLLPRLSPSIFRGGKRAHVEPGNDKKIPNSVPLVGTRCCSASSSSLLCSKLTPTAA